ncbi:MAG: hypothetical protein ABSF54_15575 [Bryobacteraceae bacterium]|jgi:hypothetical protein
MEVAAFPSGVVGPVHFFALRRFAAICFFVAMELPFPDRRNQLGELALANIGKKRAGDFFADVRPVCRLIDVSLCF